MAEETTTTTTKARTVRMEPSPPEPTPDTKREVEIEAFLDEFAPNETKRRQLRDVIENKGKVEGGSKYFQSRLKKIQGA